MRRFLFLATTLTARLLASTTIEYSNTRLGMGWNTAENRPARAVCVDAAQAENTGQNTVVKIVNVIDHAMLYNALNISGSASFKSGMYGGSTSIAFAESTRITDDKDFFVATVLVRNGDEFLVPPAYLNAGELKPGKVVLGAKGKPLGLRHDDEVDYPKMARENPARFRSECGDSFVNVVHTGASLEARFEIDEHEADKRKTIAVSLKGSYSTGEFAAALDSTLNEYERTKKLLISYHIVGTSGEDLPTNKAQLIKTIENLAHSANNTRAIYAVTLEPYTLLDDTIKSPLQVANQRMYDQYWKLTTLYLQAIEILSHPNNYIFSRNLSSRVTTAQAEDRCFPKRPVELQRYRRIRSDRERVECIDAVANELILGCRTTEEDAAIQLFEQVEHDLKLRVDSLKASLDNCSITSCTTPAEDMVPDYEYRTRFPVGRQSFKDNIALEDARKKWIKDTKRYLTIPDGNKNNDAKNDKVNDERTIQKLEDGYPTKLRNAIGDEWIRRPALARCVAELHSGGCIDDSIQRRYISTITIQ